MILVDAQISHAVTAPVPAAAVGPADSRQDPNRDALSACALFRGLPAGALEELARRAQVRSGPAGTLLVTQDEPGEALFIVCTGKAKVTVCGQNGREVTLALLRPGDVFGEVSLLDGSPRSANVVAAVDSQVLVVPREAFLQHLRSHPQTALNLMQVMARRLRRADEAIVGLALDDVEGRLCRTLVRLAREEGDMTTPGGLVLRRRPTQQELANMVGSSRETVSRTFTSLIRRGLVVPRGRTLVLTDRLIAQLPA
jgi:CRP/FNR family cyclic AMP-dependent transcriptional regulator